MNRLAVKVENQTCEVELAELSSADQQITVIVDGIPLHITLPEEDSGELRSGWFVVEGRSYEVEVGEDFQRVQTRWGSYAVELRDLEASTEGRPHMGNGRIKAPIPGQITQVFVQPGEQIESGQALLILEAMKMENEIRAPRSGKIKAVNVSPGQGVTIHEVLVEIE